MRQLWLRMGTRLLAVVLPILVCACGKEEPRRNPADLDPPGVITSKDARWKGIPEESGDGKGQFNKKTYPNEKKPRAPSPRG
jgi:hypothetical protein